MTKCFAVMATGRRKSTSGLRSGTHGGRSRHTAGAQNRQNSTWNENCTRTSWERGVGQTLQPQCRKLQPHSFDVRCISCLRMNPSQGVACARRPTQTNRHIHMNRKCVTSKPPQTGAGLRLSTARQTKRSTVEKKAYGYAPFAAWARRPSLQRASHTDPTGPHTEAPVTRPSTRGRRTRSAGCTTPPRHRTAPCLRLSNSRTRRPRFADRW